MIRLAVLVFTSCLFVACGDDAAAPDASGSDAGPGFDGGPAVDGGPDFDGGPAVDGGPDFDGGPAMDGGGAPLASNACRTWAEGLDEEDDGATRDFYNAGVGLRWRNFLGDWVDAAGTPQGDAAYATASLTDDDTPETASFDVSALVQRWVGEGELNRGFFLRGLSGGPFRFGTSENPDAATRPRLIVRSADGEEELAPSADTYLRSSTFQSAGEEEIMVIRDDSPALIRFDLSDIPAGSVESATLEITSVAEFGGGIEVAVFEAAPGPLSAAPPIQMGVAEGFAGDVDIESAESVVFAATFEGADWGERWTSGGDASTTSTVSAEPGFEALSGNALKVTVLEGSNAGLSLRYDFMDEVGEEPDAIYLRYYLRFAESWQPSFGGKLPGIAGTYGVAGWGGRPVDGTDGWSARGQYSTPAPTGNPFARHTSIGNYVYHADMEGQFGDTEFYHDHCGGILDQNRWYVVEQYIQLNTPGENDGVLRAWVDGRLVEEKTDWRWRDVDSLHIENIWMNVYHGGTATAPQDLVLYIDNVVVAREYIGPMP